MFWSHRQVRSIVSSVLWLFCGLGVAPAAGQQRPEASDGNKHARAVRVPNGTITIDGRLSEPAWQSAEVATDFIQRLPAEGAPATERSEVRFLYDDDNLYIGAVMQLARADELITNELKRDFNARDGDLFMLILDTFYDKRNAYAFMTNPRGALRDSQSNDDGANVNQNWDAVWYVQTSVTDDAWFVEKAIPFKQLRFSEAENQVWGLQIERLIRHKYEYTNWAPLPRQFMTYKVSYGGVLEGIRGVRPGRNIRVKPFAIGDLRQARGNVAAKGNGGVDVKVGLGTNFVLDGTYRTDFSQVEADAQQVNLTRFSLFFPEKREFFLENQGFFQIGPRAGSNRNFVPFFSRTIGLSDTGDPIPIVGGLRLSGKQGRSSVGLLNIQTEGEKRSGLPPLPSANFTVLRYAHEFLRNSAAGVFFMDKERGAISNRLVGSDLQFNPLRSLHFNAMLIRSEKTAAGSGTAWRGGFEYDPGLTQYTLSYTSLGPTFTDDLGFIPRQGVDILNAGILRRFRPGAADRFIREYRAELPYVRYTKKGVGVETETITPTFTMELADDSTAIVSLERDTEMLTAPFRIRPGYAIPIGTHRFYSGDAQFRSSNAHAVAATAGYRFGEFWDGSRTGFNAGGRVRFSEQLAATLSFSRDMVDLPGLSFDTNLASLRVDASFSTRMFLNAFIQYNSQSQQVLSNIRFDFIHRPLSDIFVVFNDTRSTGTNVTPPSRALILKVTQLLSF